jgi:integrase
MAKLTALKVEKERAGTERKEIADDKLAGFYLIVQPSGAKSWAVRYRSPIDGRPRKHTIGTYPAFDLGKAREAGATALRAVDTGRDPATEKQETRAKALASGGPDDKLESLFDQFMRRRVKKRTGQPLRQSTLKEDQRVFDQRIKPKWGKRRAQDITKRDVLDLLDGIVDDGAPILANRTLALVRRFFNWCLERDILAASPCAGVAPPAPETSRDRVLSDVELRKLWLACEGEEYPFGPLVQQLILTGQRVDEMRCLPWHEIDLTQKLWSLPGERAKNGRANMVPLSDLSADIFKKLPRVKNSNGNSQFVFTTTGTTPVSGEARAKQRLADAIGSSEHWTLHDIRRTVASGLQRLGFPIEVVEAILNHKSGTVRGVAAVYARHDYADEKRQALDAWARHVEAIVSGKSANVVSMNKRSA